MRRVLPAKASDSPASASDATNIVVPTTGGGIVPYDGPPAPPGAPLRRVDPIPLLIPFGSISTLSGAAGVGKTALLATVVKSLLLGEPLFDMPTNPPPAIGLIVCDRPWRDHSMWFEKAECPPLPHVSLRDIEGFPWEALRTTANIPRIFGQLVDLLNLPPGSLLIVDPLPLFIPGKLIDYKDVAIGMGHLDQQISRRQLTMIGVNHVGKQKANKNDRYMRPQDRILGSTALIGYSETAFYLLSPDEAEHHDYEFGAIPHQLPPLTLHYKRTESGLFVPAHEMDGLNEEERAFACLPPVGTSIASAALNAIICKQLGCSQSSAKRLMNRLLGDGRIKRLGRGLYERAKVS